VNWRHKTMRSCKIDVGAGRGVIELDETGLVVRANDYARDALARWADAIDFVVVPPEEKPKRRRSSSKK